MEQKPDKALMAKMGRPTKYCEEIVLQILDLTLAGKTELYISKKLGLHFETIIEWKKKYVDFSEAIKNAKNASDDELVATLREKATGYTKKIKKHFFDKDTKKIFTEEVEEYFPPDTTSIIFWLKNRQPKEWRDVNRQELTGKDGEALNLPQVILTLPDNGRDNKELRPDKDDKK